MCGIAGFVWKDVDRPADLETVRKMTDAIAHRGPDDHGHFGAGPVALGHRRLSIIDLSEGGHQPMKSEDGTLAITFNGEIYNYIELREELQRLGCQFRSRSDTEVILFAYRVWGEDCVLRFNGMWAFAIYDQAGRSIFLSRDRLGIKPLYYADRSHCFAFCSEIKGIVTVLDEVRKVNYSYLHHFLPSGALDDGVETMFEDVLLLAAGHNARLHIDQGRLQVARYWGGPETLLRLGQPSADPVEELWELINSSVALELRADVPVGTCLSGGIDSSTIVGIMAKMVDGPIHTFSGLYTDADCDESQYVRAVNAQTGAVPHPVYPDPQGQLVELLAKITWHQDEPTAGPGLCTQYYVMQEAARSVKVVLDGQGPDELFAGYIPYYALRIRDLLGSNFPFGGLQGAWLAALVARYWGTSHLGALRSELLGTHVGRVVEFVSRRLRKVASGEQEPSFFHPALLGRASGREIERLRPKQFDSRLSDTLYWHLLQQSIPALLHYEDRNSMAFGIEARVPYLDHRIVEFAFRLPDSFKIRNSWTKWVLRKSAERVVPREVAWRRSKLGYPTPFSRWIREPAAKAQLRELLFSGSFVGRELVTQKALDYFWKQHQSGDHDRGWLLYRFATVELWFRQFIDVLAPNPAVRAAGVVTRNPVSV